MKPDVIVAPVDELTEALAADFEREAAAATTAGRRPTVALPGGSVARTCFPRLARARADWNQIDFFWVDERAVPATSPESNYAIARALWLEPAAVPAQRIHRMRADEEPLVRSAERYAEELIRATGAPPRLDYVLLGVGADGHVASLFPGHPVLDVVDVPVASIEDAPAAPRRRMTLTLPTLVNARRVVVVAVGGEKAGVIGRILGEYEPLLPLARVLAGASQAMVFLDPAAAASSRF